jgi:hypothetical protein
MTEMQPSAQSTSMPSGMDSAPAFEDFDFALGCECADPALQIERWSLEASASAGEAN